jgi:hypothetical protein
MRPADQHAAAVQELRSHVTDHEKREDFRKAELEKHNAEVLNYTTFAQTDEDTDASVRPIYLFLLI